MDMSEVFVAQRTDPRHTDSENRLDANLHARLLQEHLESRACEESDA